MPILSPVANIQPIGSAKPETLYRFLQRILYEQGVDFLVAPYAASAQVIPQWLSIVCLDLCLIARTIASP